MRFTRVVAKDGAVKVPDEGWSERDFTDKSDAMKELAQQLEEIVAKLKPAKDYGMGPDGTGPYGTGLGSWRGLLDGEVPSDGA